MEVRALTFDVFGTLLDWRSTISSAFRESGLDVDPADLADSWRVRALAATQDVNQGRRPWRGFDGLHEDTLGEVLAERGLEVGDEGRAALVGAWHRLDPWPDVPAGLEALRRGRVVAALSNGNLALLVDLARHGDLRFDCLLSAEFAQVYKPEGKVYLTGVGLLGLEPSEVMMVAAHPFDLQGARRAGLRTAFIDRPLEYGPGSPPREDPEADLWVADLDELATRLESSSG
ncbi:MAG TPA: haloacid dehalogenase type II [Solirubrobacteraceae bacterium]